MNARDGDSFQHLATGLPQLVFGCLATGERRWPSPQWILFTGVSAADSMVFGWLDAIHPDDRQATMEAWDRATSTGQYVVEHRIRRGCDGAYHWHLTRAAALEEPIVLSGNIVHWVGGSVDMDDLHRLRHQLQVAEQQLRTLVDGVPQLLWRSCQMGNWTWASPQWLNTTGQTQEESHGQGWLNVVHPDDRPAAIAAWTRAQETGILDVEFRVYRASDNSYLWHRTRSMPVHDGHGGILEWLGTTTDIQDLKELQEHQQTLLGQLQYQARDLEGEIKERVQVEERLLRTTLHDDLTGLHNRVFLMDRLKAALHRPGNEAGYRCTLLFLDLDRFKLVNDSLGHQAGDLLLVEVAKRLHDIVGPRHILARFGGDEFLVLVEEAETPDIAESLADRIIAVMGRPIRLGQQEIFTSCSIGMVHATQNHPSADEMMRDADIAMYNSKRRESGRYMVFTETMRESAVEALELRTDLRNAIIRNEFRLHYQPITNIVSGTVVGVEALLRWEHPRRGPLSPAAFIAIAEESGLIREIGRWVLWEACGQLRTWLDRFPGLDIHMNINTSGDELNDRTYVREVREAVNAAGFDPDRLQLEVTESIFLNQPTVVGEMLHDLRLIGVRVALDDFGTGYSSLSYLIRYQIDTIKIDQSFVADMLSHPNAATIVKAILGLGRTMGLAVVAEGIEEDVQMQALRDAGCQLAQGYLMGRPQSADSMTVLLGSQPAHGQLANPDSASDIM